MSCEEQHSRETISPSPECENYVIINEIETHFPVNNDHVGKEKIYAENGDRNEFNAVCDMNFVEGCGKKEETLIFDNNENDFSVQDNSALWSNVAQNNSEEQNVTEYTEHYNIEHVTQHSYTEDISNNAIQLDNSLPFACGYTYQWPTYSELPPSNVSSPMVQYDIPNEQVCEEFEEIFHEEQPDIDMTSTPSTTATAVTSSCLQYPLVYVSPAGLLTVILKYDVAVELTADHTIRVVNHQQKCVAATNKQATAGCIYHTAAKVYQEGWRVDAEVFWKRRAILTPDVFNYGWGDMCFSVGDDNILQEGVSEPFKDLSKDNSVTLLFSSSAYGPHLVKQYENIANNSKYYNLPGGGVCVYINGVKIRQTYSGEVTVTSGVGAKFLKVSPTSGAVIVSTCNTYMSVDKDWNIKIKHGDNMLSASFNHFAVSDGYWHYGFDKYKNSIAEPLQFSHEAIISNGKRVYDRDQDAYKAAVRSHRQLRLHLHRSRHPPRGEDSDKPPRRQPVPMKPGEKPIVGKYVHDVQVYECPPRMLKPPRRINF